MVGEVVGCSVAFTVGGGELGTKVGAKVSFCKPRRRCIPISAYAGLPMSVCPLTLAQHKRVLHKTNKIIGITENRLLVDFERNFRTRFLDISDTE